MAINSSLRYSNRQLPVSDRALIVCCCLAALITANDACVNMVTIAEPRRRSTLVGSTRAGVSCVLLDKQRGEDLAPPAMLPRKGVNRFGFGLIS